MIYEIWIGEHYSYFERGIVHFDDGRTSELTVWIHTATYGSDSTLIDTPDNIASCEFTLRWFVKEGAIDFYSVGKSTPDVLFHNESGTDIRIDMFGVLKNGNSVTVRMSERETYLLDSPQ